MDGIADALKEGFAGLRQGMAEDMRKIVTEENEKRAKDEEAKRAKEAADAPENDPNAERFGLYEKGVRAVQEALSRGHQPGAPLGALIRAVASTGAQKRESSIGNVIDAFRKTFDDERSVKEIERTMGANTPTAGGVFAPEGFTNEVIPFLTSSAILQAVGPNKIDMPQAKMAWPRETAEGVAYWGRVEGNKPRASQPGTGLFKLDAKTLTAITSASNELLRVSSVNIDAFLLRSFKRVFGKEFDRAAFFYDQADDKPLGFFSAVLKAQCNVFSQGAAPDVNLPTNMLIKHMTSDGNMGNLQWCMGPTLLGLLMNLRNGNGVLQFPELREKNRTLLGYPVNVSTIIPVQGTSHNPTYLHLGDWDDYLLGEHRPLEIARTQEGGYYDATGTIRLTFAEDETAVRFIWGGDMAPTQTKSFTLCDDIWTT